MFILKEREHVHVCEWGWGRERGREKIPSRLHAVSTKPNTGLDFTN